MDDEVPDRLNEPMSRSAMAKEVGVGTSTLKLWSEREHEPLATVAGPDGGALYTWRQLLDFCSANLNLPATRQVRERYRERFVDPSKRPNQYDLNVGAATSTRSRPASSAAALSDGVTLRSALQDLKTQVQEHSDVVAAAIKLAENAAEVHAALLERVERLEVAVAASPLTEG